MDSLQTINPGSDLVFDGLLSDAGGAIDITGAILSVFEPMSALAPHITLAVTDAVAGAFRCTVKWSSDFPRGIIMPLRIRLIQDGMATAWPPINLWVPAR